jgi:hypothetical protein
MKNQALELPRIGSTMYVAACCQESILAADISGGNPERMRREAMEHVNHILGGIRPAIERGDHN